MCIRAWLVLLTSGLHELLGLFYLLGNMGVLTGTQLRGIAL